MVVRLQAKQVHSMTVKNTYSKTLSRGCLCRKGRASSSVIVKPLESCCMSMEKSDLATIVFPGLNITFHAVHEGTLP